MRNNSLYTIVYVHVVLSSPLSLAYIYQPTHPVSQISLRGGGQGKNEGYDALKDVDFDNVDQSIPDSVIDKLCEEIRWGCVRRAMSEEEEEGGGGDKEENIGVGYGEEDERDYVSDDGNDENEDANDENDENDDIYNNDNNEDNIGSYDNDHGEEDTDNSNDNNSMDDSTDNDHREAIVIPHDPTVDDNSNDPDKRLDSTSPLEDDDNEDNDNVLISAADLHILETSDISNVSIVGDEESDSDIDEVELNILKTKPKKEEKKKNEIDPWEFYEFL
ncbi:hypothetical protein TrCOL_g6846 [Triparma columacea]|uniref:Uncharacterized protein n=1 Tax=Triparma columacea TaxID=722753 RepID=A0A9W7L8C2_9STRA|nr:hypothetical protein TrCOL_g6846 [Triparma columacea]